MLTFELPTGRFNYRVAGICLHQDYVLLHREVDEAFWSHPGGRCELMEHSEQTLRREMVEEMGCTVQVGRLLWIVENFYRFEECDYHELALYYAMHLPPDHPYLDKDRSFRGVEHGTDLLFQWFPVQELANVALFPTFLRESLASLPQYPLHLVHHDREERLHVS